jgi:hypothetical protein
MELGEKLALLGGDMEEKEKQSEKKKVSLIQSAKWYGYDLREAIISDEDSKKEKIDNKIISTANMFINASKSSFESFSEALFRTATRYSLPVPVTIANEVNKENFREVASAIALALMSEKPKKARIKTNEEVK